MNYVVDLSTETNIVLNLCFEKARVTAKVKDIKQITLLFALHDRK